MKRIFIAIKFSEKIQSLASAWAKDRKAWPVRWIPLENLHLTLIPPWKEDNINEVIDKLNGIENFDPFFLKFKKICYGPNSKQFRLIWAEGSSTPELKELKNRLEKLFKINGHKREFIPHLTLAKFRPENFSKFPNKILNEKINWIEKIKSFELIESILLPSGAKYKVLKSFKLL